jgi:hypothetical protein
MTESQGDPRVLLAMNLVLSSLFAWVVVWGLSFIDVLGFSWLRVAGLAFLLVVVTYAVTH